MLFTIKKQAEILKQYIFRFYRFSFWYALLFCNIIRHMILKGTNFQLKVWNYLKKIPKGKVKSYLEVAKAIKKPKAFRAVANAVGKNPYPPKIPCHRVIRSDGSLGGYSGKGGVLQKRRLLRSEKVFIK